MIFSKLYRYGQKELCDDADPNYYFMGFIVLELREILVGNAYKMLLGKPERKRSLGGVTCKWDGFF
jgi:hypothetical protein